MFRFTFSSNRKSIHIYLSIFSEVCLDLHFLQIANHDTHTCPDFLKCVYRFAFLMRIEFWTHLRKSRRTENIGGFHLWLQHSARCTWSRPWTCCSRRPRPGTRSAASSASRPWEVLEILKIWKKIINLINMVRLENRVGPQQHGASPAIVLWRQKNTISDSIEPRFLDIGL